MVISGIVFLISVLALASLLGGKRAFTAVLIFYADLGIWVIMLICAVLVVKFAWNMWDI